MDLVPLLRRYMPARNTGTAAATGTTQHTAITHYCLFASVPSDFTGAIAGDQHYRGTTSALVVAHVQSRLQGLRMGAGICFG